MNKESIHEPETPALVAGNWSPIENVNGMKQLPEQQKADIRSIYERADKEIAALANANMTLSERMQWGLVRALEKVRAAIDSSAKKGAEDDGNFGTLEKGRIPVLLKDSKGERIVGICILTREKRTDWKPAGFRDGLQGAPLANTYEISGAYLIPEIRNTPSTLANLIRTVQRKIENDVRNGRGSEKPCYVYFDRPKGVPLSQDALNRFNVKESPEQVPDASPEKKGFVRYAVKLEMRDGRAMPIPWDETPKAA